MAEKYYDVYGLGNALVDIDFEVAMDTISRLQIEKGVMTLIDSDRYIELLQELEGVKHIKACGGSAANTIMAITQLGGQTFYTCKVANDAFGDFFLEELMRYNVGTNLTSTHREYGTTGSCLVLVTPDADRTMNTHLGISTTLSRHELRENAIIEAKYLYIEGYLSSSPTGSDAAIQAAAIARNSETKIALTLSDINMVKYFHARLLEMIGGGVDFLFCNEEEAKLFSQSDNLNTVCQTLKTVAHAFAVTRGSKGSIVYDGNSLYDISAHDVPVVDTVGAGDMFAGGFLYAITHGYDIQTAGIVGDILASKVISKFGPRLNEPEIVESKCEIEKTNDQKYCELFAKKRKE